MILEILPIYDIEDLPYHIQVIERGRTWLEDYTQRIPG